MASVSRDGNNVVRNNFDIFDEFLLRKSSAEDDIEHNDDDDGTSSSSSYYYEEEIIEAHDSRLDILSTVHETEDSDSNEEFSETEVLWEEVSESINHSENVDDGDAIEELEYTSDMVARVQNILGGDENSHGESSDVDSSSRSSSASEGGNSSVPPMDFDLGSFEGNELHSSDEEEDDPGDYEEACREMIATVHPHLNPETMLHGCDLQNLYTNLKQQYRHILRNAAKIHKSDSLSPELLQEGLAIIEEDDGNEVIKISFNSDCDNNGDFISPESMRDDVEFKGSHGSSEKNATTPPPKVEKWLERDADDPEDYEYACRRLSQCMYDKDDPDYDVDTMLRRSTPIDLYRYLKHHYWYLVHTNQLDEDALHRNGSDDGVEESDEIKKFSDSEKNIDESMITNTTLSNSNLSVGNDPRYDEVKRPSSRNEESSRPISSTGTKTSEEREKETIESYPETTSNDTNRSKEAIIKCDQSLAIEELKNNQDNDFHSQNEEDMQRNQPLVMEKPETGKSIQCNEPVTKKLKKENGNSIPRGDENITNDQTCAMENFEIQDDDVLSSEIGVSMVKESDESNESDILQSQSDEAQSDRTLVMEKLENKKHEDMSSNNDEKVPITQPLVDEKNVNKEKESIISHSDKNLQYDEHQVTEKVETIEYDHAPFHSNGNIQDNQTLILERNQTKEGIGGCSHMNETIQDDEPLEAEKLEIEIPSHCNQNPPELQLSNGGQTGIEGEKKLIPSSLSSSENNKSGLTSKPLQDVGTESRKAHNKKHIPKVNIKDSKELEWRKNKLQEDLKIMIEKAEELEFHQPISSEIVAALTAGSRKTALTKKYFHPKRHDHIYFPSVARAIYNFSLIEEAEKVFGNEFSFELSTALCTIAASHIQDDLNEVDENDVSIRKATVTVVLDDEIEKNSDEEAMRSEMIEDELALIMHDVQQQLKNTNLEPIVALAVHKAAYGLAYLDKFYDTETEKYFYFPSVARIVCNLSLIKEATKYLAQGGKELSSDITKTLCNVASSHLRANDNKFDTQIVKKSVALVCDEGSTMFSSQIHESSLNVEALNHMNEEDNFSKRLCTTESIHENNDVRYEISAVGNDFANNLEAQLSTNFESQSQLSIGRGISADKEIPGIRLDPSKNVDLLGNPLVEDVGEKESKVQEMPSIKKKSCSFDEQKFTHDANTFEDGKKINDGKVLDPAKKYQGGHKLAAAIVDENSSLFVGKYLDDKKKIDQALVDLESELVTGLNRLENEANSYNLKHKIEAERIEKDRKGVEEQLLENENSMMEQTMTLQEKLNTAVAVLEQERENTSDGIETIGPEKEEVKNWGWFNSKPKKNNLDKEKQKQGKLMRSKMREIELEKDVDEIKAQLNFLKQQAKTRKHNINEWKAELDEEYRHLEDLRSATEEKLKDEISHLNSVYEEERKKLLKEKGYLEENRKKDDEWVGPEIEKLFDNHLEEAGLPHCEIEFNEIETDRKDYVKKNIVAKETGVKDEEKAFSLERERKKGHNSIDFSMSNGGKPELGSTQNVPIIEHREGVVSHQLNTLHFENEKSKSEQTSADENVVTERNNFVERISENFNVESVLKNEWESVKEGLPGEGNSSESNTPTTIEENRSSAAESKTVNIPKNDIENKTAIKLGCDIQSVTTGIVDEKSEREGSGKNDFGANVSDTMDIGEDNNAIEIGDCTVPDHLASLNQPRESQDDASLRSLDVFDSLEGNVRSSKSILAAAQKAKQKEDSKYRPTKEETQAVHDPFVPPVERQKLQGELSLRSPSALGLSEGNEFSRTKLLAAALKGKEKEGIVTLPIEARFETKLAAEDRPDLIAHSPTKNLSEMRRKVEEALERAVAIRNGDSSLYSSRNESQESQTVPQVKNCSHKENSSSSPAPSNDVCTDEKRRQESTLSETHYLNHTSPSKSIDRSVSAHSSTFSRSTLSREHRNPIFPMIRETDRLAGFIRRYEKKLERVCKSLLTLASVTGEKEEVLAARQLDLPQMLDFVVKQDWYKAHSTDSKSPDVPHFIFSKMKNGKEDNPISDNRYTITGTGKLFLQIDGPEKSDVSRFLLYLNHIEEGLTRDEMLEQWREMTRISGDEQSQRVCDKLDKLISFCLDSQMIKK